MDGNSPVFFRIAWKNNDASRPELSSSSCSRFHIGVMLFVLLPSRVEPVFDLNLGQTQRQRQLFLLFECRVFVHFVTRAQDLRLTRRKGTRAFPAIHLVQAGKYNGGKGGGSRMERKTN